MHALSCSSSAFCALATEGPQNATWTRGPDDMEASLVFFSTFEELKLPATGRLSGPMDYATKKLYEPSPTQILYVAP